MKWCSERHKKKVVGSGVVSAVLCERAKTGVMLSILHALRAMMIEQKAGIICVGARLMCANVPHLCQQGGTHIFICIVFRHNANSRSFVPPFCFSEIFAFFLMMDAPFSFLLTVFLRIQKKTTQTKTKDSGSEGEAKQRTPRPGPTDRAPPLEGQILKTCRRCSELRA